MYSAGTAFLTVTASFKGIQRQFEEEVEQIGRQLDRTISSALPNAVREGLNRADRDVERAGRRAGESYAGAFGDMFRRRLDKAIGSVREVEITADSSDLDRELADVRKDLLELRDAHVNLEIDSEFAMLELRRIIEKLRELSGREAEVEVHFNMAAALAELEAVEQAAGRAGRAAGDEFADHFTREVRRRLAATRGKFAQIEIDADSSELERDIAAINTILAEIDERIRIGVGLNEGEILRDIEIVEQALRDLAHRSPSVRIRTNAKAVLAEVEALAHMWRGQQEEIERAEREAHEENERRIRDRLRLEREAYDENERREREMLRIQREAYDENERRDRERLRRLTEETEELRRVQGGMFGEQQRRRLTAGRDSLPEIDPNRRRRRVDDDFARIRAEMAFLRDLTIGVNIDEATFNAELARIIAELERIEANEVDVDVVANTRAALAELRALVAVGRDAGNDAGEEWGGSFVRQLREAVRTASATITDIPIGLNMSEAQRELQRLRMQLNALGQARIGVDMPMAEFIRQVTFIEQRLADLEMDDVDIQVRLEAAAARAGLTALHNQVNNVDRDDIRIDVDAEGGMFSLRRLADTAGISMGRLGALIAVGASLGTAIVPAAAAAAASISAIATAASAAALGVGVFALGIFGPIKALAALNQYQKDADKSAQNLSASQSRVAGALDQVEGAASNLRTAQRNLARAEKDAIEVTQELTKAREAARRQLEDMALAVKDNALAIRQARLDEAEAKKELDAVLANPRATEAEREQARITYEQRLLQMEELGIKQARLEADKAEADRKGIEGSDQVKAAQERIAAAMERVVAAQESVADSQRALAAANRSLQQSYEKTGVAGGDAMRNLREAMDALSPAGRRFALFIFGLKDEFKSLQAAAEEGLLPGLEQGIRNLLPYLEPLRTLIGNVATALGEGFVAATEALKEPVWQEFFGYLAATAVPTLKGMFEFFGNIARGIAGILLGLSGFNGPIGQGLLEWSRDFATWGTTLDSNAGWKAFIQYVKDSWPAVRDFFGGLWDFTKKFVAAAAPIGTFVLAAFAKLFEWMNALDTDTWTIIIAAIAGVAAALLAVAGITSLITTGWAGLIIGLIAAVAAEWTYLYQKVEPVRTAVQTTLQAIGTAWNWLWTTILQPGMALMRTLFDELRHEVFEPLGATFGTVADFMSQAWSRLSVFLGPALENMGTGFRILGGVVWWLWTEIISRVLEWIRVGWQVTFTIFQVVLGLFQIAIKILGAVFSQLWLHFVEPLYRKLQPFFSWLGSVIRDQVLPPFRTAMEALGKAWDIFYQATKVPIKLVLDYVLNKGLLAGYNKIAKFFNVKPDDVKIDLPPGFARGGAVWGAGTETSDSIIARLSRGEHVWTAKEVRAAGGHTAVEELRQMILSGWTPGYAKGGAVGDWIPGFKDGGGIWDRFKNTVGDVVGGIKDFFSDPSGTLKKLLGDLLDKFPDKAVDATKIALGMPAKVLSLAVEKVKDLFNWASGNGGDFGPGPGFPPWPGSPGASRGDSGVWRSVVALIRSTGPVSGAFGNAYRHGDPLWHGSGRAVDWMGYNQDALAQFFMSMRGRVLEFIHRTNKRDYAITRGRDRGSFNNALMEAHRNHIHVAMDQGGWLEPGWTTIFNGTGVPEPVLTAGQWSDIHTLVREGGAGGGPTYNFAFRDTTLDPGRLRAIQDREAAYAREGRAR